MFDGMSFLQFVGLQRSVLSFTDVEMIIKPTKHDGLIFYNGYVKRPSGDFISLALKDGFVEFRFDLGTGPAYIRCFMSNKGVGDGVRGYVPPKIREKCFSGKLLCKIRAFSGKNHVKIGNFDNFSEKS